MDFTLRGERPEDEAEVAAVIEAAFGDRAVAEFAAAIRASDGHVPELAFVAESGGEIVGHTMLSHVELQGHGRVLILTPMSVRPDRQRQGIGAALVRTALAAADERGEPFVLCEGVPRYYPRFGFRSATELGLLRPDERIPEAAWLVAPLRAYDPSVRGRVVYPPFFPPPPSDA
jgi:putative acetyltransferase